MSGKIFVNYRRGDDAGFTQALYQRLESEFSAADLFMDVEGHIKPGDDFVEVLNAQVAAADILLVVIGPRWESLLSARKADLSDFVVVEIKAGFEQGKRVIPVLVGGAAMPRAETLPDAIRALARRNAVGLRPDRFKADCQGLVTALKAYLAEAEKEHEARSEAERRAAEAKRLEAEAQAAERARAAEERGRVQAAAGLSPEEIRKAEELASWDFVRGRSHIEDVRDHLARFPGGTTERYALAKLDEMVWRAFGSTPSVEQLRAYLDEFPKGENAAEARILIVSRDATDAAQRIASDRVQQETEIWGRIAVSTDRAQIEAFLSSWPSGLHAQAARKRLRELDRLEAGDDALWIGAAAFLALVAIPLELGLMSLFEHMGWTLFSEASSATNVQAATGCLSAAGFVLLSLSFLIKHRRRHVGQLEGALYWLALVLTAPLAVVLGSAVSFENTPSNEFLLAAMLMLAAMCLTSALALSYFRGLSLLVGFIYWLGCAAVVAFAVGGAYEVLSSLPSDQRFPTGLAAGAILSFAVGAVLLAVRWLRRPATAPVTRHA